MSTLFGPLVLLSTLAGVVWIILVSLWLLKRKRLSAFNKIAIAFICAGVIIPVAILLAWKWSYRHDSFSAEGMIQAIALVLWPTSIELMVLDSAGPPSWGSIAFVYTFSIVGNVGAYGTVGFIVGWLFTALTKKTKS